MKRGVSDSTITRFPPGGSTAVALLTSDLVLPPLSRVAEKIPSQAPSKSAPLVARPISIGVCLASSLRNRWVLYQGRRCQFETEPSEEAVHELRVATRRLMAQLDLFAAVASSGIAEKGRRALKRSMKALGRLRDIQMQRIFIEGQLDSFPNLILLLHDLRREETARIASATAKVRSLKNYKFEKWISLMFQDLAEKTSDPRENTRLSSEVVDVLQNTYAAVIRRRQAIRTGDADTIHALRVAFKKFRYVVETLSPGFTGFNERELAALASYQRSMGLIQDLEIIQASAATFIEKYPAAEEFLLPFMRHLRQSRGRALVSFMKQADEILEFSPIASKG